MVAETQYYSEWQKTTDVIKWTRGTLAMPSCCYCRRPAKETQVQYWVIEPGTPIDEVPYCSPPPKFRCAPGKGCNANPKSRNGAQLRAENWDGPPTFYRPRDRVYLELVE